MLDSGIGGFYMIQYLKDNIATILISGVIFGLMAWVIVHKIRHMKKSSESSCGCGCSGCPEASRCHK